MSGHSVPLGYGELAINRPRILGGLEHFSPGPLGSGARLFVA